MFAIRKLSIGVFATLILMASSASAQISTRRMVVLIDVSGSMSTPRPSDPVNTNRFLAAKARADSELTRLSNLHEIDGVAVYTFSGTTHRPRTAGFVDPGVARNAINSLTMADVGGSTPLAGSMCAMVDLLVAAAPGDDDFRILLLESDGEENSSPPGPCAGPPSTIADPPFSDGSWHNLVLNYVVDHDVTPHIDLFDHDPIVNGDAKMQGASDADAMATAKFLAGTPGVAAAPPLADFFAELARAGGGRLTIITDEQAQLPVFADFTGDRCTDRRDAILVARAFGRTGAPQDNPFDLDADGKVGFTDYSQVLGAFTAGGCGAPDPFVSRPPIVCTGSTPITIDGAAIEGTGITIDARITCRINIRNSLIVSGQSAIKVKGSALLTIDNSILVGEGAVFTTDGSTSLSAANSVFHGARITEGAFVFVDRGGNTFE